MTFCKWREKWATKNSFPKNEFPFSAIKNGEKKSMCWLCVCVFAVDAIYFNHFKMCRFNVEPKNDEMCVQTCIKDEWERCGRAFQLDLKYIFFFKNFHLSFSLAQYVYIFINSIAIYFGYVCLFWLLFAFHFSNDFTFINASRKLFENHQIWCAHTLTKTRGNIPPKRIAVETQCRGVCERTRERNEKEWK